MNCGRLVSPHFIGIVVVILLNYIIFTFMFMLDLKPAPYIILLVIFNLLFVMLVWSLIRSTFSDPGRVPIYWGFFAQQAENRKRKYCLLCHSFKPQRCHHCSTCQRCVLNMDHHCPWIANCVGFTNRKYFMLFLFYIILTIVFALSCEIPLLVGQILKQIQAGFVISVPFILRVAGVIFKIVFFFAIVLFFKFHVELVLENSSTLDNLQRQRNPNAGPNVYDIGAYENFVQVFGTNTCMWLIPVAPVFANRANGVIWPKNQ